MKSNEIPWEYRTYLRSLVKEYRDSDRPISKEIMISSLSSMFNLSPEYCRDIVFSIYK